MQPRRQGSIFDNLMSRTPPSRSVRSLQAKMFILFALIATLPLLAMSYLALQETRAAITVEVGSANGDAANAAAGFVDVYVENGRLLLDTEARSPAFANAVQERDRASLVLSLQALRDRSSYRGDAVFRELLLLNETGDVLAASPAEAAVVAKDPSHQAAFALARAAGRLVMVPVPPQGEPVLPLAAPVFVNGTFRGVLIGDLSLSGMGAALRPFAPDPSQVVFLTDSHGRLLAHPDNALVAARPDWGELAPVGLAQDYSQGFVEYVDPTTGIAMLGSYATIPRLGWVLINAVPTEQAYSALDRLTAVLVVLSGILAGGILLATVVTARRIVAPVQELTSAAQAVATGNLSKRIEPRGRDEIAELGRTFNEMAKRIGESLDGLRRSEARYRSLVESANDLIFTVQPDGTISFVSPLTRRLLGEERARVDAPAHEIIHEGDRLVFMEAVNQVLENGEPVLFVPFRVRAADDSPRVVLTNFSPVFEGDPRPARVLAVAHDVTQERRQELIREKAFQMARLVSEEGSMDLLAHRGLLLLLAVVNLTRGAIYLRHGSQLRELAASGSPETRERAAIALAARRAVEEASPIHEEANEHLLAIPLVEHGEVLGAVALQLDHALAPEDLDVLQALASQLAVGFRRALFEARLKDYASQLETRVEQRTAELTRKSQEMESFLYSVSHDLKAPLISIQGYAQGLEEDYTHLLQGEAAEYLERIRKNATLMESLILDLLEFSRIGRIRDDVVAVDLDKLTQSVATLLSDRFAAAGGELALGEDLPRVRGEPKRLAQLFTNLLDNAIKYRHPDRPLRVRIEASRQGADALIRVTDNGRGIPPRYHDQLFKIFQRALTPGLEDPGGTGMGLAIVKRIAETHGGDVTLESREGEGTTFLVRLPLASTATA